MNHERKKIGFLEEPKNSLYQQLITLGSQICREAVLVVRQSNPLDDSGLRFLHHIAPFLKSKTQLKEWPGTRLIVGYAWVHYYNLTPEFIKALLNSTNNLYDWLQPKLPEDLCLIRPDQEPWLVTISHEKDGYLYLTENELNEFLSKWPSIGTLLQIDAFQ